MSDKQLIVDEQRLYELYSKLTEATTAASTGDPNECARLASEAKDDLVQIREESEVLEE